MSDTTRRVGSAMAWSVFARLGRFVLGLASSVVVVRSLGEHDYGVLSLVRTILMFVVMVAGSGLGQALLKFLPTLRVGGGARGARRLVRNIVVVNLVVWGALTGIAWLGRGPLGRLFPYEGIGVLVSAAVALCMFEMLFGLFSSILNADYDTKRLSIATLASHVVYIGLLAVTLPVGWGVFGVVVSAAAGFAVACAIVFDRVRGTLPRAGEGPDVGISGRRLAGYALPFAVIGVLKLIVWRQSETLLLAHFRTAAETGYFDLAYRLSQTVLEFVPGAVWPLVMAGFSELYARDETHLRMSIDRYYRMLFVLCAPLCALGVVLGGRAVPILFGDGMQAAAIPTQVFFAVFTVSFFGTPLSMALYVMEKTHVNLIVYLCLAVVNVGLDLLLIPRFGVVGAMVPVAAVVAVSPFVYWVMVVRYVDGVRVPLRFVGKCFLASGFVVVLVPLLRYVTGVVELGVASLVGLGVLTVAFRVVRVLGTEESWMVEAVPMSAARRFLKFVVSPGAGATGGS